MFGDGVRLDQRPQREIYNAAGCCIQPRFNVLKVKDLKYYGPSYIVFYVSFVIHRGSTLPSTLPKLMRMTK